MFVRLLYTIYSNFKTDRTRQKTNHKGFRFSRTNNYFNDVLYTSYLKHKTKISPYKSQFPATQSINDLFSLNANFILPHLINSQRQLDGCQPRISSKISLF